MSKLITINCITYYKNHFCKHCDERITYYPHHRYYGIPDYIRGHHYQFKRGNKIRLGTHLSKETRKKISISNSGKNSPQYIDGYANERGSAKRSSLKRGYGYIALNEPFRNASFHHIDKEKGIFIPRKLHRSIWHSVKSGKNMEDMNDLAFEYMIEQLDC